MTRNLVVRFVFYFDVNSTGIVFRNLGAEFLLICFHLIVLMVYFFLAHGVPF